MINFKDIHVNSIGYRDRLLSIMGQVPSNANMEADRNAHADRLIGSQSRLLPRCEIKTIKFQGKQSGDRSNVLSMKA